MWIEKEHQILLDIKVIPRSSREQIVGQENGRLKIKIAAVPTDNQANEALIRFLSRWLDIPRRQITIVSGASSRLKRVAIGWTNPEQKKRVLAILTSNTAPSDG